MARRYIAAIVSSMAVMAMADGTNKAARVKAELVVPQTVTVGGVAEVSGMSSVSATVAPAMPAEKSIPVQSPVVAAFAAEIAGAVSSQVPELFAAALAKAERTDVPNLFAVALSKVDRADLAPVMSAALERITEAQAPDVAAAVYAALAQTTVKGISAAEVIKIRQEWYERFVAVGGSKAYWILRIAKERAEKGEDVSELRRAFDYTMNRWLKEED